MKQSSNNNLFSNFFFHSIYWTDATPDNIVVDKSSLQISFADLDNLHIVDSRKAIHSDKIHRYERIPCDRCFAYVPVELCSHHLSDMNLFTVCQVSVL